MRPLDRHLNRRLRRQQRRSRRVGRRGVQRIVAGKKETPWAGAAGLRRLQSLLGVLGARARLACLQGSPRRLAQKLADGLQIGGGMAAEDLGVPFDQEPHAILLGHVEHRSAILRTQLCLELFELVHVLGLCRRRRRHACRRRCRFHGIRKPHPFLASGLACRCSRRRRRRRLRRRLVYERALFRCHPPELVLHRHVHRALAGRRTYHEAAGLDLFLVKVDKRRLPAAKADRRRDESPRAATSQALAQDRHLVAAHSLAARLGLRLLARHAHADHLQRLDVLLLGDIQIFVFVHPAFTAPWGVANVLVG